MPELQKRLTRLEIESSEDIEIIARAQERIRVREKEISLLKAQILVDKRLQNGSLPNKSFTRLRKDVALRNIEAMECQLCNHQPEDTMLSACGHLYCDECYTKVWPGRCRYRSCEHSVKRGTDIETILFDAMCTIFKISFMDEEEDYENSSEDEDSQSTPLSRKASGQAGAWVSTESANLRSQLFEAFGSTLDDDLSEDDGFDCRSQRSLGYNDEGNSFVSDDESVDVNANFEVEDESTTDDSDFDMVMGSEEDE